MVVGRCLGRDEVIVKETFSGYVISIGRWSVSIVEVRESTDVYLPEEIDGCSEAYVIALANVLTDKNVIPRSEPDNLYNRSA